MSLVGEAEQEQSLDADELLQNMNMSELSARQRKRKKQFTNHKWVSEVEKQADKLLMPIAKLAVKIEDGSECVENSDSEMEYRTVHQEKMQYRDSEEELLE
jgi:hypothetical protein